MKNRSKWGNSSDSVQSFSRNGFENVSMGKYNRQHKQTQTSFLNLQ